MAPGLTGEEFGRIETTDTFESSPDHRAFLSVAAHPEEGTAVTHWGTVHHLQTHPGFRCRGVGSALMRELRTVARDELGLEQLRLAARGEEGLEDFYGRLGWREVGRWPSALRFAPDDTRDEVLMLLAPL
ncbi:GNAT family N-acetyltransferase [Streptomyces sp. NPDC098101]|uniref:GNAT family N-acetyltransferase n=1 Tax=Streptomyces sp. NPDC098101 TaxID=3366096 RepID=UPI0037F9E0CA